MIENYEVIENPPKKVLAKMAWAFWLSFFFPLTVLFLLSDMSSNFVTREYLSSWIDISIVDGSFMYALSFSCLVTVVFLIKRILFTKKYDGYRLCFIAGSGEVLFVDKGVKGLGWALSSFYFRAFLLFAFVMVGGYMIVFSPDPLGGNPKVWAMTSIFFILFFTIVTPRTFFMQRMLWKKYHGYCLAVCKKKSLIL